MSGAYLPVDPGLLARFRQAADAISWRPVVTTAPGKRHSVPVVRVAHLHDEEARVETRESATRFELTVAAGPVGALVVVVEAARRGLPESLGQRAAHAHFPGGSLNAVWGGPADRVDGEVPFADVVGLARYALA